MLSIDMVDEPAWRQKACSSKKGISALQLSRECEITHKRALFVLRRIRHGLGCDGGAAAHIRREYAKPGGIHSNTIESVFSLIEAWRANETDARTVWALSQI